MAQSPSIITKGLISLAIAGGAFSLAPAVATAYPGASQTPPSYCSQSTGCYRDPKTGQNKQAKGPKLTAEERKLDEQCRMGMAKAGLKWFFKKKGGAIAQGAKAGIGPCRELEKTFNARMKREGG